MSQYFYLDSTGAKAGPVEKSQLECLIDSNTMVWCEGMSTWTPAGSVPELATIFVARVSPSPANRATPTGGYSTHRSQPSSGKPQSYMWLGIVSTALCCLPCGIVSIVFASKVDSCWAAGDYNGANENSQKAKTWGLISVGVGVLAFLFGFIAALVS